MDAAINMEDASYDNPSTEDSEDTSDIAREPSQFYTPEHPQEESSPVTAQPDFVAPPPTIVSDVPYTPVKRKTFKAKKASKESDVTISFADETKAEGDRQKKEKDLLQKFYQMEAKKKQMKAYKKPQAPKKRYVKKASRYKKLTRR
jgi:hypothetical protein